jgi:DNA-binding transcriptional regulator PaaX
MGLKWFHHPDLSLPVLRRRATEEFLLLLGELGKAVATRGRSLDWGGCYEHRQSYYNAVGRLLKQGLVAYRRSGGRPPVLLLSPQGRAGRPDFFQPEMFWKKSWTGLWYLLMYDVPESQKSYREVLRRFLQQKRMGCLQRSVWISATDMRPDFDDLCRAAALSDYAFLFESRTVLGLPARAVAARAWNFEPLRERQRWYCERCDELLAASKTGPIRAREGWAFLREALCAYQWAMERDPLLPRALWPEGYLGPNVVARHRSLMDRIGRWL